MTPSAGAWCCRMMRWSNMTRNDPVSSAAIRQNFAYWDDIAVVHDGVRTVSGGHGFAGIGRRKLLILLQERARELGVDLRSRPSSNRPRTTAATTIWSSPPTASTPPCAANMPSVFKPDIDTRLCKFVWLGTHQKFDDAFTFIFEKTEHGWVWAHVYQFDADTATFIVECMPDTWDAWGFEHMSKEETVDTCAQDLRRASGRACPDVERRPPARLGGLDAVPPGDLREVVSRECRADGRCGGDGAFLDRLRLAAGVRQRDCAGGLPAQRTDAGGGLPALSGRTPGRGAAPAIGGAQQPGMVRAGRALSRHAAACSSPIRC